MSTVFKALADPTRRHVLQLLRQGPKSAGELAEHFPVSKPTMSAHFAVLREAGLVDSDKQGKAVMYRLRCRSSTPPTVGAYFSKINCFCFTEQRLKPGERREMPVVFFIDPKIVEDAEHDSLNTITLSYTMYRVRQSEPQTVGSAGAGPRTAPSTTN